ncbi:MAG: hypothetical protein ACOYT8_03955 [Candidatus Dependentiae bacterium]
MYSYFFLILISSFYIYANDKPTFQELTVYQRTGLHYNFSKSEFFLSLLGTNYLSEKHRPTSKIHITLSQKQIKVHQNYILDQVKQLLKKTEHDQNIADCMALDKKKNSAMHLALANNIPPSRALIKILIPATNWLETNNDGFYAFDYFDPHYKHKEFVDLILYDITRTLCFKRKINFKRFYQCRSSHDIYKTVKEFFDTKGQTKLTNKNHKAPQRKTFNY